MCSERKILIPFNRHEALTLAQAAEIAGRCIETMRIWAENGLGRKIGGRWCVSHPLLLMRLDGDSIAMKSYWGGDRMSGLVAPYFERAGLQRK